MKKKSVGANYKCIQVFGYKGSKEKVHEQDIISTIKFDNQGHHIAIGDKAGRVILFKSNNSRSEEKITYFTEFQAETGQFDPLNSCDVDQQIIDIKWLNQQGKYKKLITMNSKFARVWKIFDKDEKRIIKGKPDCIPKFQTFQTSPSATLQKTFPSKHQEELIGMDLSKNQEYFICSDSVKTILWSMQKNCKPYLVADLQGKKSLQEVKQNITCLKAHPTSDSLFTYGTNKGLLAVSDFRISESYKPLKFKMSIPKQKNNFFNQMISSYSSLTFLKNSTLLAARDYLTVKVWDIKKTDKPILNLPIQQSLKGKLCDIFQNDHIYDKFDLSTSADSNTLLTGNYNNCFHTIDVDSHENTQFQINYKKQTVSKLMIAGKTTPLTKMDYQRKISATDFCPKNNLFAVASLNCFVTYSQT